MYVHIYVYIHTFKIKKETWIGSIELGIIILWRLSLVSIVKKIIQQIFFDCQLCISLDQGVSTL